MIAELDALPSSPESHRASRVAQAMMASEGAGKQWALELEAVNEGCARVAMRVTPAMLNGFGAAHGGMIFALADSAFAYACNARDVKTVAQAGSIVFLSAGRPGERLVAEAREIGLDGRSGSYSIIVVGDDKRIVATMQGLSRAVGGSILEEI